MKKGILFKKTTSAVLAALVVLTTVFSFGFSAEAKAKKYVKSIKLSKKSLTLTEGKKADVKVTVKVKGKASKKFTVKTSSKSVATAKASGSKIKITAKKAGKATITVTTKAKSKKGNTLKAKIKVTVKKNAETDVFDDTKHVYKVGKDIAAGVYTVTQVGKYNATYIVSLDAEGENTVVVGLFKGTQNIKVLDGDYLTVSRCTISKAKKNPDDNNNYCEGRYIVGKDIPAGKYIAYPFESSKGTLRTTKDNNIRDIESIIEIKLFDGQTYFSLRDGEYLSVSGCVLRDVKNKSKFIFKEGQALGEGQYLVGDDIPAGVYTLTKTGETSAYYALSSDDFGDDIITNENFEGQKKIKASEGDYLELKDCEARLTEEKDAEPKIYYSGRYKVGEEIPAGKYIACNDSKMFSFYVIYSDADRNDKIVEGRFNTQSYFEVKDGEWLELVGCDARDVKYKQKPEAGQTIRDGQFLVGDDIPAGEYTLTQNSSSSASYAITSDANGVNYLSTPLDFFKGQKTITVKDGEYLTLYECETVIKK